VRRLYAWRTRLGCSNLIGTLLLNGAEPVGFNKPWDNKIFLCAVCGLPNTLKVLLQEAGGRASAIANARIPLSATDASKFTTAPLRQPADAGPS
jgi:hypothetical protein